MMWKVPSSARRLTERMVSFSTVAGGAADGDHVADVHRVLELDEDAGDDVLHHLLGAETDGEAEHTGGGEQRADVDADLGEREHQRQDDERDRRGVAEAATAASSRARWAPCPRRGSSR